MATEKSANTYEEARKQRLLDNKKRFEDLGILNISKNLSDLRKSEKKSQERQKRPQSNIVYTAEPRRSTRARNPVPSYRDDVDIDLPHMRKRSKFSSSWASYLARSLDEVRSASYEERAHAIKCAEKLQSNLQSENPSFVKSMVRSHVYSCFWLGLPSRFCEDHLPKSTVDMILEDENGTEYEAIFISKRTGLSGGWRAFALEHKLDDGDALVFELIEPTRFKVYIVRASSSTTQADNMLVLEPESSAEKTPKAERKLTEKSDAEQCSKKSKKKDVNSKATCRKRNRK